MQSFRTELENPVVEQDIIDLEKKIKLFHDGKIDEEKFRSLRLARGVYGQRQQGVQMVRIKIPFGRMTAHQLVKIADLSDEYASSTLHATTRQDIQIHYVSLDRTPELWHKLEQSEITLREACGNTVRNITASDKAGIDPEEPFDVSPYAYEMFRYFLRNPICQEMGRKFKIAFASSEKDSAFTFIHDIGFIPKVKYQGDKEIRGFKVMVGGGLGAQPFLAETAYEFLEEDQMMPFTEAVLRIFDRFGERNRRNKARFKYLFQELGMEKVLEMVEEEKPALKNKTFKVNRDSIKQPEPLPEKDYGEAVIPNQKHYDDWQKTNVFEQKQKGFYGVYVRVVLGNLTSDKAREFAAVAKEYAADDIRITVNQGYLLKYVRKEALPHLYLALTKIGLSLPGFDSIADITACPGTDTCNLGISNSTSTAKELERVITDEYPDLIHNNQMKIKISGCMNSCGQHGIANIGFHGSSIRNSGQVLPAVQVLLGGGVLGDGQGTVADKVIKIPSKRAPQLLRTALDDYDANANEGEYFNDYYLRQGKDYFYQMFKPLADTETLVADDYIDWGQDVAFKPEIGVGECAGVVIDLVQTLFHDAEEKLDWAKNSLTNRAFADSIYHSYTGFVNGAKALLLGAGVSCNTQHGIISDFQKTFVETGELKLRANFPEIVFQMKKFEPTEAFAVDYFNEAKEFLQTIQEFRNKQLEVKQQ